MAFSFSAINEQIHMLHKFVLYIRTNRTWFVFECGKFLDIFVQFSDLLIYSSQYIFELLTVNDSIFLSKETFKMLSN